MWTYPRTQKMPASAHEASSCECLFLPEDSSWAQVTNVAICRETMWAQHQDKQSASAGHHYDSLPAFQDEGHITNLWEEETQLHRK